MLVRIAFKDGADIRIQYTAKPRAVNSNARFCLLKDPQLELDPLHFRHGVPL